MIRCSLNRRIVPSLWFIQVGPLSSLAAGFGIFHQGKKQQLLTYLYGIGPYEKEIRAALDTWKGCEVVA